MASLPQFLRFKIRATRLWGRWGWAKMSRMCVTRSVVRAGRSAASCKPKRVPSSVTNVVTDTQSTATAVSPRGDDIITIPDASLRQSSPGSEVRRLHASRLPSGLFPLTRLELPCPLGALLAPLPPPRTHLSDARPPRPEGARHSRRVAVASCRRAVVNTTAQGPTIHNTY